MQLSEASTDVHAMAMSEIDVAPGNAEFAVVLPKDGPLAVVSRGRAEPNWHMSYGDTSEDPFVSPLLVAAVSGLRDGILAVAWVSVGADGQRAEVVVEDLSLPGEAIRTWTTDRESREWQREATGSLLRSM